ncbi:MAG: threonine aldolase family protein [Ktedonobacterales bacterium]
MATSLDTQKAQERAAIFAECNRFLNGHGRKPLRETLQAMAEEAGKEEVADIYGTGALIEDFEQEIASLLGKEAAVFLPTGTMAQQIALRIWSERTHCTLVGFHPTCHLQLHEQMGYERLHGLHARLIGEHHRLLTLEDLQLVAEPLAALLIELPQREIGGQLPEWDELKAEIVWAREHRIAVHLDGARLWEAAPYYGREYAEVAALFDSVYVSFYKGIGGISGAMLTGTKDFIAEARVWQVRHGGRPFSLFPYVLAARAGLRLRIARFPGYHTRAVEIADVLSAIPGIMVKPLPPQTHMMHVYLPGSVAALSAANAEIARESRVQVARGFTPTELPGYSKLELTVGDAVEAFSIDEIGQLFRQLMHMIDGNP